MADKTTSIQRHGSPPPKTRLLIVRQPVKSVRASEHPDPLPVRLAIGVIVALGSLAATWMLGWLGVQFGFARTIGLPALQVGTSEALRGGVAMLLTMPLLVMRAAVIAPLWFMVGFLLIAIPAGGLAAARPSSPGGPRPHPLTVFFSRSGAIVAATQAVALLVWIGSPMRLSALTEMPVEPAAVEPWIEAFQITAGLDVLAVTAAALWAVLSFRLAIPSWLRALSASAAIVALVLMSAAMAASCGSASQITLPRTLVAEDAQLRAPRLLIGRAGSREATLFVEGDIVQIDLVDPPRRWSVAGPQSILAHVRHHAQAQEVPR